MGNGSDELIDLILRLFRPGARGRRHRRRSSTARPPLACTPFYAATNDLEVLDRSARRRVSPWTWRHRGAVRRTTRAHGSLFCRLAQQPRRRAAARRGPGAAAGAAACWWCWTRPMWSSAATFARALGGRARQPDRAAHLQQVGRAGRAARGLWRLSRRADAGAVAAQIALQRQLARPRPLRWPRWKICRRGAGQRRQDRGRARPPAGQAGARSPSCTVYPSQANYVLCRVQRACPWRTLRAAMERARHHPALLWRARWSDCIRISVGTPMQDEALLLVLRCGLEHQGGEHGNGERIGEISRKTRETDIQPAPEPGRRRASWHSRHAACPFWTTC